MRRVLIPVAFATLMFLPQAGAAQQALFDANVLTSSCAAGSCATATQAVLETLGNQRLTPAQRNSQLAILAAALVRAAQTAPASAATDYSAALQAVAAASTDTAQAQAITLAARTVRSGNAGAIDINTAFAASPA